MSVLHRQRIHDWELIRPLGQGGMGAVFLCRERCGAKREVALKLLLDPQSERAKRIFRREVQLLRRLDHPGVAQYVDDREAPNCLVMEYVEGRTLRALLQEPGGVSPEHALRLFEELALTLHYVHARGVWHRDLKPSNVVIDASGRSRVVDFGISIAEDVSQLTAPGVRRGTPRYMPPEAFVDSGAARGGATTWDVYSLGVMLFEALSGRVAFRVPQIAAVKLGTAHLELGPEWPEGLRALVRDATALDPDARLANMADFARRLRGLETEAWAVSQRRPVPGPASTWWPGDETLSSCSVPAVASAPLAPPSLPGAVAAGLRPAPPSLPGAVAARSRPARATLLAIAPALLLTFGPMVWTDGVVRLAPLAPVLEVCHVEDTVAAEEPEAREATPAKAQRRATAKKAPAKPPPLKPTVARPQVERLLSKVTLVGDTPKLVFDGGRQQFNLTDELPPGTYTVRAKFPGKDWAVAGVLEVPWAASDLALRCDANFVRCQRAEGPPI